MLEIKIKKLNQDAVIPGYSRASDAAVDLTAISKKYDNETFTVEYGTGLAIQIPEDYVGLIFPRSSIYQKTLDLSNAVGVIDSGYTGEIKFKFTPRPSAYAHVNDQKLNFLATAKLEEYEVGDRVGQLIIMPRPKISFKEVSELNKSDRGDSGFGSSNK